MCCDFHDTMWCLQTHAVQSQCMSGCSMLSYMHPPTEWTSRKTHNSSSHGRTTASTTAAWAHLRALRDTGNTCHGTPDLGEGSSGAHARTTCQWNAKRRRQDHGRIGAGTRRGCPTSNGDKQAIRLYYEYTCLPPKNVVLKNLQYLTMLWKWHVVLVYRSLVPPTLLVLQPTKDWHCPEVNW